MKKLIIPVIVFFLCVSSSSFGAGTPGNIEDAIDLTKKLVRSKAQEIKDKLVYIRENLSKNIETLRSEVEQGINFSNRLQERGIKKWHEPKLQNEIKSLDICIGAMSKTLENRRRQLNEVDNALNKTAKNKKQGTKSIKT